MSETDSSTDHTDRSVTRADAVAALGVSSEFAQRIWNAFGFPQAHENEALFTRSELDALSGFVVPEESADSDDPDAAVVQGVEIAAARVMGQSMSRLADWQAARIVGALEDAGDDGDLDEFVDRLQLVQNLVWRRHLMSAIRNITDAGDDTDTTTAVIGFADIVGYTSLSRGMSMRDLNDLLGRYENSVQEVVARHDGLVVKTLGDGVLFEVDDTVTGLADTAADLALNLLQISESHDLPRITVGMALGPVLHRHGDVFGEAVNIAARLSGSARPGSVLIDAPLGDALTGDRFYTRSIGPLNVRGYKRLRARTLHYDRNVARPAEGGDPRA